MHLFHPSFTYPVNLSDSDCSASHQFGWPAYSPLWTLIAYLFAFTNKEHGNVRLCCVKNSVTSCFSMRSIFGCSLRPCNLSAAFFFPPKRDVQPRPERAVLVEKTRPYIQGVGYPKEDLMVKNKLPRMEVKRNMLYSKLLLGAKLHWNCSLDNFCLFTRNSFLLSKIFPCQTFEV